jgi:hypothetical protein
MRLYTKTTKVQPTEQAALNLHCEDPLPAPADDLFRPPPCMLNLQKLPSFGSFDNSLCTPVLEN